MVHTDGWIHEGEPMFEDMVFPVVAIIRLEDEENEGVFEPVILNLEDGETILSALCDAVKWRYRSFAGRPFSLAYDIVPTSGVTDDLKRLIHQKVVGMLKLSVERHAKKATG